MKKTFRAGPLGAAEACLYEATRFGDDATSPENLRLLAAGSLSEAASYLAKAEPEFRVRSLTFKGLVILLSGSPHC